MHPILFQIGNFPVATYGVMIMLGVLAALLLMKWLTQRHGMSAEPLMDLAFIAILSGLVGGRVLYILTNWNDFLKAPMELLLSRGGFVFLGGLIVATATCMLIIRARRLPFFTVADVMVPALALAHGFGRLGCNFAGCCYGRICTAESAWGVTYPLVLDVKHKPNELFNFAYFSQMQQGLIPQTALAPLPVLPIQLVEAAGNFLICGLLLLLWRRRRSSGLVFGAYLLLYGAMRFLLEFWRGDIERKFVLGGALSTSQLLSIGLVIAGGCMLAWRWNKGLEALGNLRSQVEADVPTAPGANKLAARKPLRQGK